jgi:hypothetical protein
MNPIFAAWEAFQILLAASLIIPGILGGKLMDVFASNDLVTHLEVVFVLAWCEFIHPQPSLSCACYGTMHGFAFCSAFPRNSEICGLVKKTCIKINI